MSWIGRHLCQLLQRTCTPQACQPWLPPSACALHLSKPQTIDTQPLIGPRWQSPTWTVLRAELQSIFAALRSRNACDIAADIAAKRLEWILPNLADAIEDELVRNAGSEQPKARKRCRGIEGKWKPIIESSKYKAKDSAATRWMLQLTRDLRRFREVARDSVDEWTLSTRLGYDAAKEAAVAEQVANAFARVWDLRTRIIMHLVSQPGGVSADELGAELETLTLEVTKLHDCIVTGEKTADKKGWHDWKGR